MKSEVSCYEEGWRIHVGRALNRGSHHWCIGGNLDSCLFLTTWEIQRSNRSGKCPRGLCADYGGGDWYRELSWTDSGKTEAEAIWLADRSAHHHIGGITFDGTGATGNNNGTKIAAADGLSVVYDGDFGILAADKTATATLNAGETKTYRLFIWLDEQGDANDVEQGAVFNGTVHVDVVGAGQGITGVDSSSR